MVMTLPAASARFVIDTDAGVDDAVAIILALHAFPREAVLGVTTVFGNVDLHQANHNVAHILEACGRTDVSVHSGASKPIVASVSEEKWAGHGPDGLGGISGVPDASSPLLVAARKNDAVHTLVDLAHKHKGELVVFALGPLTNLALATLIDPNFMENVKQVVVMGGTSRGEGNLTKHSEFNVGCDPEATSIVLQHSDSADKVLVLPFETSTDHALPWATFDRVFPADAKDATHAAYIRKIWSFTKAFANEFGFVPCDAYAVAILLHPEYVKTARAVKGSVHLGHDEFRGASVWTEVSSDDGQKQKLQTNATLVTEIDEDIFVQLLEGLTQRDN